MRAMQVPRFGDASVLTYVELPDPTPGPGEVTIDVTHAAVGLVDVMMRRGDFPFALPLIPGLSVSGHIRALGAGVTDRKVGEPVAAFTAPPAMGGYATIARVNASLAIPLDTPDGIVPLDAAAAAVVNGPTAYLALSDITEVRAGTSVVVHGATGALASAVIQVARHLGANPLIGTVSDENKREAAVAFGCSHVLLTSDDLPARVRELTLGRGAEVVIDPVGGPLRRASLDMLRPLGRLVAAGHASNEPDAPVSPTDLWLNNQAILGLNTGALSVAEPERFHNAGSKIMALVAQRKIKVSAGKTFPLTAAGEAQKQLEARTAVGTLLLQTDHSMAVPTHAADRTS